MPFLDVLVHATGYQRWGEPVRYAARFAARHDAHLTGIYIRRPLDLVPPDAIPPVINALIEAAEKDFAAALEAKPAFLDFANAFGVRSAEWLCAEGDRARVLTLAGTWHDLLVLGSEPSSVVGSLTTTEQAVIEAGVPCIVVPDGSAEGEFTLDRIALAWNGSIEAMRAIHSALPLLVRAREVVLLAGRQRESFSTIRRRPAFDLQDYLARHHIPHRRIAIEADERDVSTALLDAAGAARADLLVMGAYGRARFSEWVLGGTTRHALRSSRIPLFMRH